jgi:hypothetical protein
MRNRDVTKSTVIITIAVSMGAMFLTSTPAAILSSAQTSLPFREWKWENATVVVKHDIFVKYDDTLEIRNSTIIMDSRWRTIGITVTGSLLMENSTIRSAGEEGYYFDIFGVAVIENSTIEDVKSIDQVGEGMMAHPMYFKLKGSTVRGDDAHAITFYFPWITMEDFIEDSDVQGVMLIHTFLNAKNSSLGHLYFEYGPGEFHLWNCDYDGASASNAAFGYIFSYRFVQVHTSLPGSDLKVSSWDEYVVDEVVTDDEGNWRMWYPSKWSIVDPAVGIIEFDNNPFTFEASKMVVREFRLPSRGATREVVSIQQEYWGIVEQNIEENPTVEISMRQV